MVNKQPCISVKKASFGYRKNKAETVILKDIDLQCEAGDFIGIAGLNGSGKSTLLRSICGLQPVLRGEVLVNGTSVSNSDKSQLAKIISVVLTEKIAGFNLTCFDAVAAGQMPYTDMFNKLEKDHLEIIEKAILTCGLSSYKDQPLSELSDGLFQKTMIAKSIAQQTPVMLLDEPSAFLDYASKHELFLLLKKLTAEEKKCVLVSSHDLDLILKYCNKILLVKNSTIEMVGVDKVRGHNIFTELSGGYL